MISKLQRVPLRDVWKDEARDFTRWLEENIDILEDVIDLRLTNVEREKRAGSFNVDLLAEDDAGNPVIIENQLEKSDHDHLGKLITYAVAFDAKAAVWITAEPRPEHIKAISWLNESYTTNFYLLKLEAVRIDDSPPAPLLTLIVGPSEESEEVGEAKKDWAERDKLRYRFWEQLLERARQKTELHANISPSPYSWIGTSAGVRGLSFTYAVRQHESVAQLYIDRGKGAEEENKKIFDRLFAAKEEIEAAFGEPLEWRKLEGRRACRIQKTLKGGYRDREEKWPKIHDDLIETMIRLERALKPHLEKLRK